MSAPPPPMEAPANLLEFPTVKTVLVTRMYLTAMFTIVIWDWIVTFSREYRYIWKSEFSPIKVIFLLQRYYSLTVFAFPVAMFDGNHSESFCASHFKLDAYLSIPILYMGSSILLIRCYAIWERNNVILGLGLVGLATIISLGYYGASTLVMLPYPPGVTHFACIGVSGPGSKGRWVNAIWLGPTAFDLLMTALTSWRVRMYMKHGTASNILLTFWRDGVFFYLAISAANILNSVFFLLPDQSINAINTFFALCINSVLAQRMVLHLRSQGDRTAGSSKPTNSRSGIASTVARGNMVSAVTEPGRRSWDSSVRIPMEKYQPSPLGSPNQYATSPSPRRQDFNVGMQEYGGSPGMTPTPRKPLFDHRLKTSDEYLSDHHGIQVNVSTHIDDENSSIGRGQAPGWAT